MHVGGRCPSEAFHDAQVDTGFCENDWYSIAIKIQLDFITLVIVLLCFVVRAVAVVLPFASTIFLYVCS